MALSPLMQQYQGLKQKNPDALLFFRCGDFYEMFFEDAEACSERLGITLTARGGVPMAGVPHHSAEGYIAKLVRQGCRVAVAEQIGDPKLSKGLVERAVVEVVTPGTVTAWSMLEELRPNYVLAIAPHSKHDRLGLAWLDVSLGRLGVVEIAAESLGEELARLEPAEVLVPDAECGEAVLARFPGMPFPRRYAQYAFDAKDGRRTIRERLQVGSLRGFGCENLTIGLGAAGALLRYLTEIKPDHVAAVRTIEPYRRDKIVVLDPATRRALEVVETARGRDRKGSLLWSLDRTRTAMGARVLREWLLAPLSEREAIEERFDAVAELVDDRERLDAIRDALKGVHDLERLGARVAACRATPRDLAQLRASLGKIPAVREGLSGVQSSLLQGLYRDAEPLPEIAARLERELVDDPPLHISDGELIRDGVRDELDELRAMSSEGKSYIARFQKQEIQSTGIPTLKIGHNNVFGYYIEVTNTHRAKVPTDRYQRKQTLKNSERYITPELKRYEEQVTSARERSDKLERELFTDLRDACEASAPALMRMARAIAEVDVLVAFAHVARERGYVRPTLDGSRILAIDEGRHPVLERTLTDHDFVPNDVMLGFDDLEAALEGAGPEDEAAEALAPRIAIVTGPNMAGKSTFCRQVALIVLMAQAGSFVPAKRCRIGVVDRVFARLGSADEIASGLSTFMVEMTETAYILNQATARSLVILDEVGRGTSTFDGVSLAFAITQELASNIGANTLFATHYHELTELGETDSRCLNLSVDVKEWGEEIVFLHRIRPGATDKSYGLHVARLAGVPERVTERAKEVLAKLEGLTLDRAGRPTLGQSAKKPNAPPTPPKPTQLDLFAPPAEQLKTAIVRLDVANLTPLKALLWLSEWQEKLRGVVG